MSAARVVVNRAAVRALERSAGVGKGLERVAKDVAEEMRQRAPRRTGALANAITTGEGADEKGRFVDIGTKSRRFFYWIFEEFGTEHAPAQPFVRPSLHNRRI